MSNPLELKQVCDIKSQLTNKHITYEEIAYKLIQDRFLLTALELHRELSESGRELKQLKEYFLNPGNFESQSQELEHLSRSGSQVTLDSLDLTRYSEDGATTEDKVAVLEFELRRAKETINALRNNLTLATEYKTCSSDKSSLKNINVGTIKPHEQRPLNFLINEYLLHHGYKLTSITFADENQSQDFDDWEDVGLNTPRPPELLFLFREGLKQTRQNSQNVSTQTKHSDEDNTKDTEEGQLNEVIHILKVKNAELNDDSLKLKEEIKYLSSQLVECNKEKLAIDQKDKSSDTHSKNLLLSPSVQKSEICEQNISIFEKDNSNNTASEDNISENSFTTNDWFNSNVHLNYKQWDSEKNRQLYLCKDAFIKEVFSLCYINIPHKIDNDFLGTKLSKTVTNETFIHLVASSLLRIIPNIILNKREEVIPLLIGTVHLNTKASERDKLLQQLFNLKKKPSESERMMILTGLLGVAKCSGECLVENEILPQCWLQLTHKYVERRLLVAEACIALMPYMSNSIRNSLCLSMLQQMLEDKEEAVRETVIKALSLLASLCNDPDKYAQCETLAMNTLNDCSNAVINLSIQILFPVLGKWALNNGFLITSLFKKLLYNLNLHMKNTDSSTKVNILSDKILRIINVIENLLPFLLLLIAAHEHIMSQIEKDMALELRSDFKNICTNLTNPEIFFKSDINCGMLLYEFDKYIADNNNTSWKELDWVVDVMLPDLFNSLHHIEITQQSLLQSFINLFSHICIAFGCNFTKYKIRPLLQNKIKNLEQIISSFNQFCPSLNIIPVYLTVLTYSEDFEELANILKKFLCALPLCGSPLDCLEITVRRLCESGLQEIVVDCLWSGVVHQRPLIRAAAASLFSGIIGMCNNELLKSKVTGALITLASDNDILVRTAAIPAIGNLITDSTVEEIHDKAYMQLQMYLSDANLIKNHTLLRQIIVTLGSIVNSCTSSFRNEVILPQLTDLSCFTSQMTNQTRKIDMALALLEAYTNVVYCPLNKQSIRSVVMPGLRCLEAVVCENQSLNIHHETVLSLIKECDNKDDLPTPKDRNSTLSQNVNQGVVVKQKVSKIFNKPNIPKTNTLPNLQNIFKKK